MLKYKSQRQLVVLGCSATKRQYSGQIPAISLYDGPMYRVLRTFLRSSRWPREMDLAILSAKYGLIGGLSHISHYDMKMTGSRAAELSESVTNSLSQLSQSYKNIELVIGQDYVKSINFEQFRENSEKFRISPGPIGMKLSRLRELLYSFGSPSRIQHYNSTDLGRSLYFLPDWDDFLDADFDFESDTFSSPDRQSRKEIHSISLMRPRKLCDGVLVSLAQHLCAKGILRRFGNLESGSLAPTPVRDHYKLVANQWAFGDCGAFSYVAEKYPTISVEQAVSLYDLYEFDFGASVDHIPMSVIPTQDGTITLSEHQRRQRVEITKQNAADFIETHREHNAQFIPVGIIQGLSPRNFANQISYYWDLGYRHIALGGLVPRSDNEIKYIVEAVDKKCKDLGVRPWIHLFGIFRPKLQNFFRSVGIDSFDSATYFRKSWLRSDQNYLGTDGNWYAAIRVPPTSDARTMIRLRQSGLSDSKILSMEKKALSALRDYDKGALDIDLALEAVAAYDNLLQRGQTLDAKLLGAYRKTLEIKPWKMCSCQACSALGIDILIFRGLNRNKRRGAHNTLMLFQSVQGK